MHQIGWALIQYGQTPTKKVSILYKRCLGVVECPVPDCKFRSRPRLPRNQRTKNAAPRPGKITHCNIHTSTELVHNSCAVLITVTRYPAENCVQIDLTGTHSHHKPSAIRPTFAAKAKFCEEVRRAPHDKPIVLVTGTSTRPPM